MFKVFKLLGCLVCIGYLLYVYSVLIRYYGLWGSLVPFISCAVTYYLLGWLGIRDIRVGKGYVPKYYLKSGTRYKGKAFKREK